MIHTLYINAIHQLMQYMPEKLNKLTGPEYSILKVGFINCQLSQEYLLSIHCAEYCSKSQSA